MKKLGFLIFIIAIIIGVGFAGFFSWGKAGAELFDFNFSIGRAKGSGNIVSETRDLRDFKAIEVGGVFHVEVVAQKDFSVQVEADDNLLEHIKTEVHNGVLEISTSRKMKSHNGLKIKITAPDIERLEVSGVAKISVADLKNAGLRINTSGASKINLSGETDKLIVEVSGASNIEAETLKTREAAVESSGASKVSVFATESLRADASGASRITYTGGATDVVKKTSGTSSVSQR